MGSRAGSPAATGQAQSVVVEFDQIRAAMLQTLIEDVAAFAQELAGGLGRLDFDAVQHLSSEDRAAIRQASQSANHILSRIEVARSLGTIDRMLRTAQSPHLDADGVRSA